MRTFLKYAINKVCVCRSIMVSLVVGTVLVLTNQLDAIFYGPFTKTNLIQIIITYFVPYLVATYCSAMQAKCDEKDTGEKAEELIRTSQKLLSTIVESAPIRIFWKDLELCYLGCNTLFARDAGMSCPADLIGKNDLQMGWREQAELYRVDDKQIMDSKTPKIGYEEQQTRPDGNIAWVRTSKVPLQDVDKTVFGMLGIYEDITERKKAEQKIKDLAKFPEENKNPVYRVSKDGVLLYANSASRELILEDRVEIGHKIPEQWSKMITEVYEAGKPHSVELKFGKNIFLFTQIPVVQEEYINVYGQDITERKKSEEKLQTAYFELKEAQSHLIHAEKMEAIGRMASGVAHEVKNPLGIILLGINYFEGTISATQKDKRETLLIMKNSINRVDKIVCALLDFSRSEELKMKSEDVTLLINSSLGLVEHKLKIKNIKLFQQIEKDMPKIIADRGKIEQVLINLFSNSIDAMPKGGELYVRSYKTKLDRSGRVVSNRENDFFKLSEEAVVVEVEDTGVGIDEEIKKKLFDPFFTTKDRTERTGLGLSVVKSIIDMHRGLINVESEKGKGAKFTMIFKLSGGA